MRAADVMVTQTGRVIPLLVEEFCRVGIDDKIPVLTELSHRFGVGTGTVQKAIQVLQAEDAVVLEPRGVLGTFIRARNMSRLVEVAGRRLIVCGMPLPYSRRYEGLASGIKRGWTAENLPLIVGFMRGALQRLDALMSQHHDFTVVSGYTARVARERGYEISVVADLGPGSYLTGHAVFFAEGSEPRIQDGYRIGIDRSSIDQVTLTELVTADIDVELIDVGYMQLIEYLQTKRIDAAVWSAEELSAPLGEVTRQPLPAPEARKVAEEMTIAVVLTRFDDVVTQQLLDDVLDYEVVAATQREVLAGERLPAY